MLQVREQDIDRLTQALHELLGGKFPTTVELPPEVPDNEVRQLAGYLNRLLAEYAAFAACLQVLSRGELDVTPPKGRMQALQSLKNLHANLRHLTWKTQQIAKGDFAQQVDFLGEFSTAFNSMTRQLKGAFETIEEQNRQLADANDIIRLEKDKSDRLLLNVLPARVAEQLKGSGTTTPELFENVTVLFSDLVGFTKLSAELPPARLIAELNDIFTQFDTIIEANGCERIKTIGDAYLAVCGMPTPDPDHACRMVRAAVEMVAWLQRRNASSGIQWLVRVGIHSGPVVGAVVGVRKYIYDVFGDTVNTASRMESHSEPMRINVSAATRDSTRGRFAFAERAPVEVKGKGTMRMYFVEAAVAVHGRAGCTAEEPQAPAVQTRCGGSGGGESRPGSAG
jgi:class 3 adenylate cyclase